MGGAGNQDGAHGSVLEDGDNSAHVVQRGSIFPGIAGQLDIDVLLIPDILAVDFVFQHAVLKQGDMRMFFS